MKKIFLTFILLSLTNIAFAQYREVRSFVLSTGFIYNQSNMELNTTTSLGIHFEPKFFIQDKWIIGYRFEPVALMYGVLVLPGGCTEEHPVFPGMPFCREGSNYLLNNYFFADYRLGKPKYGPKGGLNQYYAGFSLNYHGHQRYIITSMEPFNWRDKQAWVGNLGAGIRLGVYIGRIQLNTSFNVSGKEFQPFFGSSIGYLVIR